MESSRTERYSIPNVSHVFQRYTSVPEIISKLCRQTRCLIREFLLGCPDDRQFDLQHSPRVGARLMAQVMTRCPENDRKVSTGLWMTHAQLQALTTSHAFRCAACGKVHQWVAADAWVTSSPGRVEIARPDGVAP
jgi:hypothetical protein